jgi:hypothetical protein
MIVNLEAIAVLRKVVAEEIQLGLRWGKCCDVRCVMSLQVPQAPQITVADSLSKGVTHREYR